MEQNKTRFYLIRHGETDWNKGGRYQGCTNIQLNDAGREQARLLGERFKFLPLDVVYVSPLDRAVATAAPLAAAHGLTPVIRDFRPWYPQATVRSRELGMYRQNYCGCRFSAAEAALDRARMRDERKAEKARRAALKD